MEDEDNFSSFSNLNGDPSRSGQNNSTNNDEDGSTFPLPRFTKPFTGGPPADFFRHYHEARYLDKIIQGHSEFSRLMKKATEEYDSAGDFYNQVYGSGNYYGAKLDSTTPPASQINRHFGASPAPAMAASPLMPNSNRRHRQQINGRIINTTPQKVPTRNLFGTSPSLPKASPPQPANLPQAASVPNLEDFIWPNGTCTFFPPEEIKGTNGKPIFGWTFLHFSNTCNNTRRYYYCQGVMQCPVPGCTMVSKSPQPTKKALAAPPKQAKKPIECPLHKQLLTWTPCGGGDPSKIRKKLDGPVPCTITTIESIDPTTGINQIEVQHVGEHDHPRPPQTKPTKVALEQLNEIVNTLPDVGPERVQEYFPRNYYGLV